MARFTLNDLKAKGYEVKGGKAVKLSPELTAVIRSGNELQKLHDDHIRDVATDIAKQLDRRMFSIFIPMNVPSSKNSKRIVEDNATGKKKIIESKLCGIYRKETKSFWIQYKDSFLKTVGQCGVTKPYRIEFFFVRSSNRRFDFHNAVQLVMDLMTEHLWIDDDNANEVVPVPPEGKVYHVDKSNPGVYISLIR